MRSGRLAIGLAALLALSAADGPASARDVTPAERAALAATVGRFAAAARDGDSAGVVAVMPPRLLASLAGRSGLDGATVRSAIIAADAKLRAAGVREALSFDLRHARFASLSDGTLYGLVPSRVTMTPKEGRAFSVSGETLALREGGAWYLVDIGDAANLANLRQAYPAFADVDLTEPGTKP